MLSYALLGCKKNLKGKEQRSEWCLFGHWLRYWRTVSSWSSPRLSASIIHTAAGTQEHASHQPWGRIQLPTLCKVAAHAKGRTSGKNRATELLVSILVSIPQSRAVALPPARLASGAHVWARHCQFYEMLASICTLRPNYSKIVSQPFTEALKSIVNSICVFWLPAFYFCVLSAGTLRVLKVAFNLVKGGLLLF